MRSKPHLEFNTRLFLVTAASAGLVALLTSCASEGRLVAATPQGVDLSGQWRLNENLSDDPGRIEEPKEAPPKTPSPGRDPGGFGKPGTTMPGMPRGPGGIDPGGGGENLTSTGTGSGGLAHASSGLAYGSSGLAYGSSGSTPDCLTAPQVAAVRSVYTGVKTADGRIASYPLSRGGEASWSRFVVIAPVPGAKAGSGDAGNGLGGLRQRLFGNGDYDLTAFDAERDLGKVRGGEFADLYEAKNPNIAPFIAHGGKLLLWHGFDDPGPSPLATIEYYENVRQTTGSQTAALDANVRLFLLSGVYHCRGGPGADGFDSLAALDRWVESGPAPDDVIATREDGKLTRPLCRYPTLPRYKGSGDPASADSFQCR